MAYFERGDEANKLIVCNICGVSCKESGLTVHKSKCSEKPEHRKRFAEGGDLQRCQYDSSHIVKRGNMSMHLEFCTKYQNKLVAEFQSAFCEQKPEPSRPERVPEPAQYDGDDSWGEEANCKPFLSNFRGLKLQ